MKAGESVYDSVDPTLLPIIEGVKSAVPDVHVDIFAVFGDLTWDLPSGFVFYRGEFCWTAISLASRGRRIAIQVGFSDLRYLLQAVSSKESGEIVEYREVEGRGAMAGPAELVSFAIQYLLYGVVDQGK